MLLKFKNKHLLAIEKLIKESDSIGGIIESIILEPKEGMGLLLELIALGKDYTSNIIVRDINNFDVTREKLIWAGLRTDKAERVKDLVKSWYKAQYTVFYKDIPLQIVKPKPKPKTGGWKEETTPAKKDNRINSEKKNENKPTVEEIMKSWKTHDIPPAVDVPKPPPNRIIQQDTIMGICEKCGSSLKSKWFFFKAGGCIQPACENYWETKNHNNK